MFASTYTSWSVLILRKIGKLAKLLQVLWSLKEIKYIEFYNKERSSATHTSHKDKSLNLRFQKEEKELGINSLKPFTKKTK